MKRIIGKVISGGYKLGILDDKTIENTRMVTLARFERFTNDELTGFTTGLPANKRITQESGWSRLFMRKYYLAHITWDGAPEANLILPDNTIKVSEFLAALNKVCPD